MKEMTNKYSDTQEFLEKVFNSEGFYCSYGSIYQVSLVNGKYKKKVVAKKAKRSGVGFSLRGHVNIIPKSYVDEWKMEGIAK